MDFGWPRSGTRPPVQRWANISGAALDTQITALMADGFTHFNIAQGTYTFTTSPVVPRGKVLWLRGLGTGATLIHASDAVIVGSPGGLGDGLVLDNTTLRSPRALSWGLNNDETVGYTESALAGLFGAGIAVSGAMTEGVGSLTGIASAVTTGGWYFLSPGWYTKNTSGLQYDLGGQIVHVTSGGLSATLEEGLWRDWSTVPAPLGQSVGPKLYDITNYVCRNILLRFLNGGKLEYTGASDLTQSVAYFIKGMNIIGISGSDVHSGFTDVGMDFTCCDDVTTSNVQGTASLASHVAGMRTHGYRRCNNHLHTGLKDAGRYAGELLFNCGNGCTNMHWTNPSGAYIEVGHSQGNYKLYCVNPDCDYLKAGNTSTTGWIGGDDYVYITALNIPTISCFLGAGCDHVYLDGLINDITGATVRDVDAVPTVAGIGTVEIGPNSIIRQHTNGVGLSCIVAGGDPKPLWSVLTIDAGAQLQNDSVSASSACIDIEGENTATDMDVNIGVGVSMKTAGANSKVCVFAGMKRIDVTITGYAYFDNLASGTPNANCFHFNVNCLAGTLAEGSGHFASANASRAFYLDDSTHIVVTGAGSVGAS